MPWNLQRFQEAHCLPYITFSCQNRDALLETPEYRDTFLEVFELTRKWYGFYVCGYVVMPEHVHLISEPERGRFSTVMQTLKQNTARKLQPIEGAPFWEPPYLRLQCLKRRASRRYHSHSGTLPKTPVRSITFGLHTRD